MYFAQLKEDHSILVRRRCWHSEQDVPDLVIVAVVEVEYRPLRSILPERRNNAHAGIRILGGEWYITVVISQLTP